MSQSDRPAHFLQLFNIVVMLAVFSEITRQKLKIRLAALVMKSQAYSYSSMQLAPKKFSGELRARRKNLRPAKRRITYDVVVADNLARFCTDKLYNYK